MKKIVSIVGMAALVAGLSFADAGVSIGGWSRAEVNVSSTDGSDATFKTGPTWAGTDPTFARVGFNFSGHSDNAFAALNLDSNGNTFGVGDQAKVGVKFNDFVTVQVGKIQGDALRGKIGDLYASEVGSTGEDDIFKRFYPSNGALVEVTVAGLYLGAADDANTVKVADGSNAQFAIGYTIDKIGLIRAQYIGSDITGDDPNDVEYQVAFNLTAVDKLNLDAGFTYDTASATKPKVAVGASYSGIDKTSIDLRARYQEKNTLVAGQVGYNVDGPLTVGAGASLDKIGADKTDLTAAVFAKLGYSNGYGKIGFKYEVAADDTKTWTIPATVEVWF